MRPHLAAAALLAVWCIGIVAQITNAPAHAQTGLHLEAPNQNTIIRNFTTPWPTAEKKSHDIPFKIECHAHNFTPFIVSDKNGEVLFRITCP